jgi:hypothetical protein
MMWYKKEKNNLKLKCQSQNSSKSKIQSAKLS